MAFPGTLTLRVTAEVVLSGQQAMSVFTPLGVRNSLAAGRIFILLNTYKRKQNNNNNTKTGEVRRAIKPHKYSHPSTKRRFEFGLQLK